MSGRTGLPLHKLVLDLNWEMVWTEHSDMLELLQNSEVAWQWIIHDNTIATTYHNTPELSKDRVQFAHISKDGDLVALRILTAC